jgi:hypothetical protein
MSVETSRTNQPGDGDADDEQTFGYRSADSAVDHDLDNDDLDDDTVVSGDDEDDLDDDAPVVQGTVYDSGAADYGTTDYGTTDSSTTDSSAVVTDVDDPRPTFTPVDDGSVTDGPDANAPTLNETDDVPVVPAQAVDPVTDVPVADTAVTDLPVADTAVTEAPLTSAADIDPNAPLLGDPVGLRASWQQAQAGFVDDPRAAVAEAAELVEHTAQTLIGSLQQRQRALRTQWDDNGSGATAAATAGELSDTEQLRHLMQDYRNLFNQLCRP